MRFRVLVNGASGGGRGKHLFPQIEQKLKALGISADCSLSRGMAEALALAKEAREAGYDFLIAGGGDGTVHQLLPVVVHQPMGLGILPLGTANDLARSWGIPLVLDDALALLSQGRPGWVDVIQTDSGAYIGGAAGIGFDVAVVERAEPIRRHWPRGILPFLLAMTIEFFRYDLPDLAVQGDNWRFEGRAWQVIITKIPRYALRVKVLPQTRRDDGRLTVCIVPRISKVKMFFLFPAIFLWGLKILRPAHCTCGSVVEVRASRPLPIHGDGELIGKTPVSFRVVPRGLKVLLPEEGSTGIPSTPLSGRRLSSANQPRQ